MAVCALNMRQLSKVSGSRGRLINQTIDMILKKLKISKCQKLKASGQRNQASQFLKRQTCGKGRQTCC